MSGTYLLVTPEPGMKQITTTDSYPGWQHKGDYWTLFLFGWDDSQFVCLCREFTTNVSPVSTCCQTSTGNSYESPLVSCGGIPGSAEVCLCSRPPGVT